MPTVMTTQDIIEVHSNQPFTGHHKSRCYLDRAAGVYRWASNDGAIEPKNCRNYGIDKLPEFDETKQAAAFDKELKEFLRDYRARNAAPTGGQKAEMIAAFGPGAKLVDVITGRRIQL